MPSDVLTEYYQEITKPLAVGDVVFFSSKYDRKKKRDSFIGYERSGKVIISGQNLHRAGFFKIRAIKAQKENYSIVSLGERVMPTDLYDEISLPEAVHVLEDFGFKTFSRKLDFSMDNEVRHETQLLAWHDRMDVWVNGTTFGGDDNFNDLEICFPNKTGDFAYDHNFAISTYCIEEVTIDVKHQRIRNILGTLLRIQEAHDDNYKAGLKMCGQKDKDGEKYFCHLSSYVYAYVKESDSIDNISEYEKDVYNDLPVDGKQFVDRHRW